MISIHAPLAGRDALWRQPTNLGPISIHAPLAGRDVPGRSSPRCPSDFNPRAPCGARQRDVAQHKEATRFQSTRPLRGATPGHGRRGNVLPISIHAPLAGRDTPSHRGFITSSLFQSTRPLRGATPTPSWSTSPPEFQSTRPLRGATATITTYSNCEIFQSTRPLRGATFRFDAATGGHVFQSTRPLRGATVDNSPAVTTTYISIHAPLAGRDPNGSCWARTGERFQSTRPLRGATGRFFIAPFSGFISIHAPLAGRDVRYFGLMTAPAHFNPRAPCGARRLATPCGCGRRDFNPRAPCGARL